MNVKAQQYLIAIAEQGNLSRAAKKLGITQAALSKFLLSTEEELNTRLFQRSNNLYLPTEAGEIYLDTCRKILDVSAKTSAAIEHLEHRITEIFRIGVSPYRGLQLFSKVFPDFYSHFPNVQIELVEGNMSENIGRLLDRKVNLVVGSVVPETESNFCFASITYEELQLAVPLSHPLSEKSNDSGLYFPYIDIRNFENTPFIMWGEGTTNRKLVDQFLSRSHLSPIVVYESNNAFLINEMLKYGISIGFLPVSFCQAHQNRVYFSTWPPIQTFLGVCFPKNYVLTPAEEYFIHLMSVHGVPAASESRIYYNRVTRAIIKKYSRNGGRETA